MAQVRISPTIANDLMSRAAEHLPEHIKDAGVHTLNDEEAKALREDALFQADTRNGPEFMEPSLRSAYRALAQQLSKN